MHKIKDIIDCVNDHSEAVVLGTLIILAASAYYEGIDSEEESFEESPQMNYLSHIKTQIKQDQANDMLNNLKKMPGKELRLSTDIRDNPKTTLDMEPTLCALLWEVLVG